MAIVTGTAAFVGALYSVVVTVAPVMRSDDPPWQGRATAEMKFDELAQNFRQLQNTQADTVRQLGQVSVNADLMMHQFWQAELDRLEKEGAPLPQRRVVIDNINQVRLRLGLPLIPRP